MAKKASKAEDILAPPEGLTQEEAKSVSKRRRLRAAVVLRSFALKARVNSRALSGRSGGRA